MQTKPRILINRTGALGDVILTTPIIRRLYEDRGGFCEIHVRTLYPEVFRNNPFVVAVYSARENVPSEAFDLIINLDLVYEKNPMRHILDAYGFYVFGNASFDRQCQLFPEYAETEFANKVSSEFPEGHVVIHMRNTSQGSRNLPVGLWRDIVFGLLSTTRLGIVQVGSPAEYAFGNHVRLKDLRGQLTIQGLREIIGKAKLFIGVDSAPFHVAATTETDMAVFFTTAKFEYRKPFRRKGRFLPLVPTIDCYGCQEKHDLGSTFVRCLRGDEECVNRFDANLISSKISALLEKIKQ
jgi:ADP-heptose:LPS heptosyltransferase